MIITRYFNGEKISEAKLKNIAITTPELEEAVRNARSRVTPSRQHKDTSGQNKHDTADNGGSNIES